MSLLLIADIGGTNARLGVIEHHAGQNADTTLQRQAPKLEQSLRCADYADPEALIRHYCNQAGIDIPQYACLAIAGPVENGMVKMTNHNWSFSAQSLTANLGMTRMELLNDFAAQAHAVPHLRPEHTVCLYQADAAPLAPKAVLGPGTGFGAAAMVPTETGPKVLTGEGGHVNFAPGTEREIAILQYMLKRQAHVSLENLISGQGLVKLYTSLAAIDGVVPENYTPADVSTKGMQGEDALCEEAMQIFCAVLGSAAGDKTLNYGALGGIYLAGGISPRIVDYLPKTDFLARLQGKGPMHGYLRKIPVYVVTHGTAALLGSAAWIIHLRERDQQSPAQ
ncbi:glucokinase [Marinimicrobium alkaliphilum]|uniref:glucokinase n=1 Tax=Marinimicrobium alkaliphilum TaxID=2202654 RepID=UPI000DBA689E|nr:glucokinase [Marinimicrobium alkaliphilum]